MAVPYGYWLNHVGDLLWGMKLWGCAEVTKDEYQKLFKWAASDRNAALKGMRAISELAAATEAHNAATHADDEAKAKAEKEFDAKRDELTAIIADMPPMTPLAEPLETTV